MTSVLNIIAKNSPHLDWIVPNTILLVQHGSKAYNCHTETSDEDFKGVCVPSSKYWHSFLNTFEQAELKAPNPDTVIYNVKKFFQLGVGSNPNILEMMFVQPQHQLFVSPLGEKILDNRDLFLSKKARFSFAGFAFDQMRRVKLHRAWLQNPPKEPPTRASLGLPDIPQMGEENLKAAQAMIKKETDRLNFNFLHNLTSEERSALKREFYDLLLKLSINPNDAYTTCAKKLGMDDNMIYVLQKEREFSSAKENWRKHQEWKVKRNPERAADEAKYQMDLKFAYHIVRLYRTCKELLETGKLNVFRLDREEMLEIRSGKWTFEQLNEFMEKMEIECDELYKNSSALPYHPDSKALDRLCQDIVEESLRTK